MARVSVGDRPDASSDRPGPASPSIAAQILLREVLDLPTAECRPDDVDIQRVPNAGREQASAQEQPSVGTEHTCRLSGVDPTIRRRQIVERPPIDQDVEVPIVEREHANVADDPTDVCVGGRRTRDRHKRGVDSADVETVVSEESRLRSEPAAEIENARRRRQESVLDCIDAARVAPPSCATSGERRCCMRRRRTPRAWTATRR